MKVALVILHADPARGGAERYSVDLAGALAARGHDVALLASSFVAEIPDRVARVSLACPGLTRLGRYFAFLDALDQHIAAASPGAYDIVHAMLPVRHCDIYHPHAGIAAAAIQSGHLKHAGRLRQTLARFTNRLNLKRNRFAKVERTLLTGSRPPVVLCLSDYVKGEVQRHYPQLPEGRLARLFNAVDLKKFDPAARPEARADLRGRLGIAPDRTVALMIAQDFQRKGLPQAIAALRRVPGLTLLVVGKEDPAPYASMATQWGLDDRVIFAGPTTDPVAFYAASDFFVLPTRHDPCSLVVLEALAMGLPVISTAQNGACEIMTDGVHGYVLPNADDLDALVAAMKSLVSADAREPVRQACLRLRPKLAYEHHIDTLEQIYGGSKR